MKFASPQVNKDGSVRMRDVTAPIYLLKDMQTKINKYLKEFDLPDCMYGGVDERNNVANALQHIRNKFFLTIDLKNFFGNITNSRINQTLISNGLTWEEARILTRITTFRGSLPQGAPTSTTLANLTFAQTASFLEKFCTERNIRFTVFVDDLTFSSSQCFRHYKNQILDIIKQNDFFVNQKKIRYRRDNCEITGLCVRNGKLSLPKEILANIAKRGIKEYAKAVKNQCQVYNEKAG